MKLIRQFRKNRLFKSSIVLVIIMCLASKLTLVAAESSSVYVIYTPTTSSGENQEIGRAHV